MKIIAAFALALAFIVIAATALAPFFAPIFTVIETLQAL
jgi:hypothetical protein